MPKHLSGSKKAHRQAFAEMLPNAYAMMAKAQNETSCQAARLYGRVIGLASTALAEAHHAAVDRTEAVELVRAARNGLDTSITACERGIARWPASTATPRSKREVNGRRRRAK